MQTILDKENRDENYDTKGDFEIVRDYTWKRCISLGYSLILNSFIKREKEFKVEYEDLVCLAKKNQTDILAQLVEKSDFKFAHKTQVFAKLFSVPDKTICKGKNDWENNINLGDIISAMLDAGYSGEKIWNMRE